MRSLVLSVGHKPPSWIEQACTHYASRLPKDWQIQWRELRAEPRANHASAEQCKEREAQRIQASLQASPALLVALDERGSKLTSSEFAAQCQRWHEQGDEPAFVIGSADGLRRVFYDLQAMRCSNSTQNQNRKTQSSMADLDARIAPTAHAQT
ncbi:MAG: hypothetical protein EBW05_11540 [Betaproteobacteria bacterium]|nr:hypothetical protein [Betaproteobacteria bacterium]